MPTKSANVFVSYSHADVLLVSPVVKLLRVNKSLVFQDIDTIEPGKRWRGQIGKGLAESQLVVVFWCTHASASDEAFREWQEAIELKKDLLPLLLDATPLPPELAEFQWIDFRGTVGPNHSSIGSKDELVMGSAATRPALSPAWRLLLTACAAVFAVALVLVWFLQKTPPPPHPKSSFLLESPFSWESPPPWSLPPFPLKSPAPWSLSPFPMESPAATPPLPKAGPQGHLLYPGIVLILIICLICLWKATKKMGVRIGSLSSERPGVIERHIASEVAAEILRRTTFRREGQK